MSSPLSNFIDNPCDRLHSDKYTDCKSYLDYMPIKDDQLIFRCFDCKKNCKKDFNNKIYLQIFANIYEFCDGDINKFILLLRKDVIHINARIAGKDLMKYFCLTKKNFTVV